MQDKKCENCNSKILLVYSPEGYYYECSYCGCIHDENGNIDNGS